MPLPSGPPPRPTTKAFTVYVAVPEYSFRKYLDRGRLMAGVATACTGFAAVLIMTIAVYVLTRPIRQIACELELVANLELESVEEKLRRAAPSPVSEVHRLRVSFATLVRHFIEYRAYLPRSLLSQIQDRIDAGVTQKDVTAAERDLDDNDNGVNEDDDETDTVEPIDTEMCESRSPTATPPLDSVLDTSINSPIPTTRRHSTQNPLSLERCSTAGSSSHTATTLSIAIDNASVPDTSSVRSPGIFQHASFHSHKPLLVGSRVTVMSMNLLGTHASCRHAGFAEHYYSHMSVAVDTAMRLKGIPMYVFGDRLMITWNAVSRCTTKEKNACTAALCVIRDTDHAFSIGIATGMTMCGDMRAGRDMRSFVVLGAVVSDAVGLQNLARPSGRYNTNVLVSGYMYTECNLDFCLRVRDAVRLSQNPMSRRIVPICELLCEKGGIKTPSHNTNNSAQHNHFSNSNNNNNNFSAHIDDGEWMYAIDDSSDPLSQFNELALAMLARENSNNTTSNKSSNVAANNNNNNNKSCDLESGQDFISRYQTDGEAYNCLPPTSQNFALELCENMQQLMDGIIERSKEVYQHHVGSTLSPVVDMHTTEY
eukprot:PhM_4_TR3472/c1_g1_i1/m.77862